MKRFFYPIIGLLTCLLLSVSTTSCGDDNNEPDPISPIVSLDATYKIDLSWVYFKFYDITATYTDANGELKTVNIDKNTDFSISTPIKNAPKNFSFKVVGNLKKDMPAIGNEPQYPFNYDICMTATLVRKNGSTQVSNSKRHQHSVNATAYQAMKYLEKHTEIVFCDDNTDFSAEEK